MSTLRHFVVSITSRFQDKPGCYSARVGMSVPCSKDFYPSHGDIRVEYMRGEKNAVKDVQVTSVTEVTAEEMSLFARE
jgi:hypothetical protein